jgi:hypothetical protein
MRAPGERGTVVASTTSVAATTLLPVAIGLIGSVSHGLRRRASGRDPLPAVALWWLLALIIVSGSAVLTFWIDPPYFAREIGYARTPFQFEVSGANLAAVITLLVSLRVRSWRLPAVAFYGIFLCVAAGGHIFQYYANGDHAAGNGAATWITDVVAPLVAFVVLVIAERRPTGARQSTFAQPETVP